MLSMNERSSFKTSSEKLLRILQAGIAGAEITQRYDEAGLVRPFNGLAGSVCVDEAAFRDLYSDLLRLDIGLCNLAL